ncbi:MAG: S8 family serine peptidase, partial [Candidatus Bathyarchaeia archaeon]
MKLRRQIFSIILITLVLLGLLLPISISFVQAENELVHVIIDTVGHPIKEHEDDITKLGGKVRYKYKLIDAIAISLPESVIEKLKEKPWIKRISLDREVHALLDVSVPTINAQNVWNYGYDGSGIKVAICDTGIDKNHPDLKGKVVAEKKFLSSIWGIFEGTEDNNGHGTHCAGIVAGTGAASGGKYKGVAPGALLINAKCLDMFGSGYLSDVIAAIEWSVNMGADVISLSIGAAGPCDGTCDLCRACDKAVEAGVVVVVAAGNSGPDSKTITCPGNARNVITVGATDDHGTTSTTDDTIAEWSSRGPTADGRVKPDVVAPGVNIMS